MTLSNKDIRALRKIVGDAMRQVIKKGHTFGADADKWVTLSNGAAVELDGEGNLKKGMGGGQKGKNIKEAAKAMKSAAGGSATNSASAARHGSETKTPSGQDKTKLDLRDKAALSNAGKFTSMANAESHRDGQKYRTNILKGEGGQLWVPATNREESILKRLGYAEAK